MSKRVNSLVWCHISVIMLLFIIGPNCQFTICYLCSPHYWILITTEALCRRLAISLQTNAQWKELYWKYHVLPRSLHAWYGDLVMSQQCLHYLCKRDASLIMITFGGAHYRRVSPYCYYYFYGYNVLVIAWAKDIMAISSPRPRAQPEDKDYLWP